MRHLTFLFLFAGFLSAQLKIEEAFPNLNFQFPVEIVAPDDDSERLFVVSQPGKIYSFKADQNVLSADLFLDIEDKVLSGGEQGLLGLAFHPNFAENGIFFIDYTRNNPRRTIISRMQVKADDPNSADINSETILLEIEQPYSNHNGGKIAFGPDGYLYISLGDGGSAGDPQNNGQNTTTLLGSILRIDVDNKDAGKEYGIPSDNPLMDIPENAEEIYAYGLRNVWKFSFDFSTNMLWAADVGQNLYEEINIIEKGKNYGWRIMEGFHCYNPSNCNQTGLELPIHEYGHNDEGGYSITGGYVYRGLEAEEIYGKYIYGDFVSGNIWALEYSGENDITNERIFDTNHSISTFGVDQNNNLYFANYGTGRIYKITGTPVTSVNENEIPKNFILYQNYPNPFNPSTKIEYRIIKDQFFSIKVYDTLGNEISTLFEGKKKPGTYEVTFNADSLGTPLSSGIYYYKLESNEFSDVKKMILLK